MTQPQQQQPSTGATSTRKEVFGVACIVLGALGVLVTIYQLGGWWAVGLAGSIVLLIVGASMGRLTTPAVSESSQDEW